MLGSQQDTIVVEPRRLHIRLSFLYIQCSRYPLQLSVRHIPSFLPPLLFINSLDPEVSSGIDPVMKLSFYFPFVASLALTVAVKDRGKL